MARFEDPSPEQLEKPPWLYGNPVPPPGVQMEVVKDLGQVALVVASSDRHTVATRPLDTSLNLRTVEGGEQRGAPRREIDGMGERGRTGERRRAGDLRVDVQPLHVRVSSEAIESGGQLARRRLGDGEGRTVVRERKRDPSQPPTKGSCFDDWKTSEDRSSLEEPQYKRSEAVALGEHETPCRIVIAERHRLRPYEPFPVRPVDRERGDLPGRPRRLRLGGRCGSIYAGASGRHDLTGSGSYVSRWAR